MKDRNSLCFAPTGTALTVKSINASGRKQNFYISLGIFPGSTITIFMREKNGVIIKAGKTKLALAGKAAQEIICDRE